jgi:GntR family transcriptional regulator/MocR family aminotransferase
VVTDAYLHLEAAGYLVIRPRGAPVVAAIPHVQPSAARPEATGVPPRFDLTPSTADLALFPFRAWSRSIRRVLGTLSPSRLDYADPRGDVALREALADHLGRTRGVVADPEQVIVVQGTAQGVDVVLRTLRATRGATRIAVEDPSHPTQQERIRAHSLTLVPKRVDSGGIVVEGLDADCVLVTPAHQYPTGSVLSGERRRELLAWSSRTGGLIVEDDYDSEYRYDREPVGSLQGLAPQQVFHLGTVSKTLAPAIRLGWVIPPLDLVDALVANKRLVDDFSPTLEQLALADLLRQGEYDRHIRRAREVYRRRRDALLSALAGQLPHLRVEGVAAGLHLLLRLPAGVSDAEISITARHQGLDVPPLSAFRVTPGEPGGLVMGYGRLRDWEIAPTVRLLAEIIGASGGGAAQRRDANRAGHREAKRSLDVPPRL